MSIILSEIGSSFRPAAKKVIKGGLVLTNTVSEFAAEAGKEFQGLVTEARTELDNARAMPHETAVKTEGICHRVVDAGHWVWAGLLTGATTMVSTANEWFAELLVLFTGERKEKAEEQVKKLEKRLGKDLAEDECVNVIETLIAAAVE